VKLPSGTYVDASTVARLRQNDNIDPFNREVLPETLPVDAALKTRIGEWRAGLRKQAKAARRAKKHALRAEARADEQALAAHADASAAVGAAGEDAGGASEDE
jgi:hypothetical protein